MTKKVLTLDGRPGFFRVVSLPTEDRAGGVESGRLTQKNADREAEGIKHPKAIFWHYDDEQKRGKEPVRHLVGDVPYDMNGQEIMAAVARLEAANRRLAECKRKGGNVLDDLDGIMGSAFLPSNLPKATGVWAACEAWLISKGTAAGKAGKKRKWI